MRSGAAFAAGLFAPIRTRPAAATTVEPYSRYFIPISDRRPSCFRRNAQCAESVPRGRIGHLQEKTVTGWPTRAPRETASWWAASAQELAACPPSPTGAPRPVLRLIAEVGSARKTAATDNLPH